MGHRCNCSNVALKSANELERCHNVPGRNGGQIAVQENGVEVSGFLANALQKCTSSSKRKFPGQEVSVPANPTPAAIQEDIKAMHDYFR